MAGEWVDINLRYSELPNDEKESELAYPVPGLDVETREKFGETYEECLDRCNFDLKNEISIQVMDEVAAEVDEDQILSDEELDAQDVRIKEKTARRFQERDPEAFKANEKCKQIQDWLDEHPLMVAWNEASNEIRKRNESKTFEGRGLHQPPGWGVR